MPLQALALKKYRGGTAPVSKTSDNEHTPSPLRDGSWKAVHSDVLSVKHSPGRIIPELLQPSDEGGEVPSSVG